MCLHQSIHQFGTAVFFFSKDLQHATYLIAYMVVYLVCGLHFPDGRNLRFQHELNEERYIRLAFGFGQYTVIVLLSVTNNRLHRQPGEYRFPLT